MLTSGSRRLERADQRSFRKYFRKLLSPTPALPALTVQVAAMEVVHDYHRKFFDEEAVYSLSPEVLVRDDLGPLHTVREQRRRTLDGPEVHAPVLPHRLEHILRAQSLADHSSQAAFDQQGRIRVHPRGGRRSGGSERVTRAGRGGARVVHDVSFRVQGQRFAGLYSLLHPGVGGVAGYVEHPVEADDVARSQWFDLLLRKWRFQPDGGGAHSSAEAVRWEWQSRLTATGNAAMWVGKLSTWTASAVCVPP